MTSFRKVQIILASLMATFIVPITVASTARADATITKTFTVTNPNGTPYAGALVQIYYWDGHDNYPSPTVTDSSGHASITIPYALEKSSLDAPSKMQGKILNHTTLDGE